MRLIYVIDYCFQQTPDGAVWTDTTYSESFWEPYLDVYEEINLVCRVNQVLERKATWQRVNNSEVVVTPVVNYSGAIDYLRCRRLLRRQLDLILSYRGVIMLRMPSNLARYAAVRLKKVGRPFGVDVVGDPWFAMAPGVVTIRGRAFFRWLFTRAQKNICAEATAVTYVASTIAIRYPADVDSRTLVCSDVRLDKSWLLAVPREPSKAASRLVTVATLSQVYKGIDILLRAIAICKSSGLVLELTIVGTGRYSDSLQSLARSLGIGDQVTFRGVIPWGPRLMEELDRADFFVLPSLVEVMPRALLEAMARGLPCIATRVGAIADVLSDEDTVESGDDVTLAFAITSVINNPERMKAMSRRNLETAQLYDSGVLMPQWLAFHHDLCRWTNLNEKVRHSVPLLREPDVNQGFEEHLPGEQIDAISS